MAKRLEDLPHHPQPQLNLLIMCACGCGEQCNDGHEYVQIEGEYFVDEHHWARIYEAKITRQSVTYWDGEKIPYDQWREGVVTYG